MSVSRTVQTRELPTTRRRPRTSRVWTGIKVAVLAAFLAGCGFVALSLFRGTWMVTPVLSGSMRPGFSVGGVVISERTPLKDITVRDVIVFQNPYKHTEQMIHRIIKLTRESGGSIKIKTKGDDNPIADPWTILIKTRYVYQIKASVPLIGYFAVAYQDNRGLFVMVAGLLLLSVPGGLWLRSRAERQAEEREREGESSEREPAGPTSTRRPATALAASGDGRRRSGSHASGWGLRWRKRAGDPAHLTAPAQVLRPYRIAIQALSVALIAAVALLGASVYQDYAWLLVTVAGLLALGVAASTLLTFPKRPVTAFQSHDSTQSAGSATAEPATAEKPVIAIPRPATDADGHGADTPTFSAPPATGAQAEDEDGANPTAIEEPVGPSPVGADVPDGGHAEAAQPEDPGTAKPVAVDEPIGAQGLSAAADSNGHEASPVIVPEHPANEAEPNDPAAIAAAAAEVPVEPGSIHGGETVASAADGRLELLGPQREPVDAGAGRR